MKKTAEDLYVKNIENAIRSIRLGSKEPKDTRIGVNLNALKKLNEGLYEELILEYKMVFEDYKKRKNKKEDGLK